MNERTQLIGTYATYLFISPLNPFSTIATLVVVLLVTSIKEGLEDLARARSDREENTRLVTVCRFFEDGSSLETQKESRLIQAGDVIKLTGVTQVPVDLILILTSNFEDGNQCYIETSNIDGETNLKLREAPSHLKAIIAKTEGKPDLSYFNGRLEVEPPNKNIHNFVGALHLKDLSDAVALGPENILLRSSVFSNTDWAYGIAVYTGQETKIQMNNRHAPSKMSKVESYMNRAIILIFIADIILVCLSVVSVYLLGFQNFDRLPYIYTGSGTSSILPLWLEQL